MIITARPASGGGHGRSPIKGVIMTRKLNYRQIPDALRARETFEGNTMRAIYGAASGTGQLDPDDARAYTDLANNNDLAYTVLSYRTPIAWVSRYGTVTIPDRRYSTTTSRQQNLCRAWLQVG